MKGFNMKNKLICSVILVLMLAFSFSAFGEETTTSDDEISKNSFGLFIAPFYPPGRFNLSQEYGAGIRYTYSLTEKHKLEIGASYIPFEFFYEKLSDDDFRGYVGDPLYIQFGDDIFASEGDIAIEESGDVDAMMFSFNYIYNHKMSKIHAYFPMGIGMVDFSGKVNRYVRGDDSLRACTSLGSYNAADPAVVYTDSKGYLIESYEPDTKWFINFGIGMELILTDSVSLKGEVRDYLWRATEIYYLQNEYVADQIRNDVWGHVFSIEVGLYYNF